MATPLEVLQSTFGYSEFRLQQEEIIATILSGRDSFVLMPTGGGKSLCYQVPALVLPGLTIVVSPLVALMKDQVDALRLSGVSCAYYNSSLAPEERREVLEGIAEQKYKLLYVSPERLMAYDQVFLNQLRRQTIALFAIDEAHCISMWGHDFRPEYGQLTHLRKHFANVPIIALTATADQITRRDIIEKLSLRNPAVFVSSFNRANIRYTVEPKQNATAKLLNYLDRHKNETGIVYVLSRNSAEDYARRLELQGFSALPYHAGLETDVRKRHQELFLKDEVNIIVATTAFGMGINKSNVRFVVHLDLPKNIEGYYQETGRAGRDGLPSEAVLFYSPGDVAKLKRFAILDQNPAQTKVLLAKLDQMVAYCERSACRRQYLLNYFGEAAPEACANCDACTTQYTYFDGTVIAQKALSAVARLGKASVGYLIDFLRGSRSERIFPEHKQLPTYGVGANVAKDDWQRYIRELLARGYLKQVMEETFAKVMLTPKSPSVLKGLEKVELVQSRRGNEAHETAEHDLELFERLRTLRAEAARAAGVPPFVIFSDATLVELATYFPQTPEELAGISGFGEIKIARYGEQFLAVIRAFAAEHHRVSCLPPLRLNRSLRKNKEATSTPTKLASLELFQAGKTIDEVAVERGLLPSTIENHLVYFVGTGELSLEMLVPNEKISAIKELLAVHKGMPLSFIKLKAGDDISYGELRAVSEHLKKQVQS